MDYEKRIELMDARLRSLPKKGEDQGLRISSPKGSNLMIFEYDLAGRPYVKVFSGRALKPAVFEVYKTDEARQRRIAELVSNYTAKEEEKAGRRSIRSQHGLVVGQILYDSWGYDQTNVNYYQVIEVSGASVVIREVAQRVVSERVEGTMVVPVPGKFIGPPMKKRPSRYGSRANQVSVKVTSSIDATPWDGEPHYQTSSYAGH